MPTLYLFALSSLLCAAPAGALAMGLCAAVSLAVLPAASFRTEKMVFPMRLLAAVSFVLRMNALFADLSATQNGTTAVLLCICALGTVLLQLPGTETRAARPAIPLCIACLALCALPLAGAEFARPPLLAETPAFAPALLSAAVCPVSAVLSLRKRADTPPRLWLAAFVLLGLASALPSVCCSGVFGKEVCAALATPFCASLDLRAVFCQPALPAYTATKTAKGRPCNPPETTPANPPPPS